MEKVFKVADIRKFEQQVTKGDISYSRMVELMNEMAHTHYVVNKNCNKHDVSNRRELFDKFYEWLDGLSQTEYDDMSLTDKCEKFFFKT